MKTRCEELISLARKWLDTRRPGRRAERQALQADAGPPATAPPGLPDEDLHLDALARAFPRELFAQLLIELPACRDLMAESFAAGNYRRLRDSVHRILGATAYCEAHELEQELRQLGLALKTDNSDAIEHCFRRAMQAIDDTLHNSGYRKYTE